MFLQVLSLLVLLRISPSSAGVQGCEGYGKLCSGLERMTLIPFVLVVLIRAVGSQHWLLVGLPFQNNFVVKHGHVTDWSMKYEPQ